MKLLRQILLAALCVAAAVAVWIAYVPSAAPLLERAGVYSLLGLEPPAPAENGRAGGRGFGGGGPAQVVVTPVEEGRVNARVTAIGDGRAARAVTVRSEAAGLVARLAVEPGSYVERGALVAELDDAAERIALERARLVLADAEDDQARLRQLQASGSATAVQMREAELALKTAALAVEQAEFDLTQRRIEAPIAGWFGLLEIEEGDRIATQDAIGVITDRSEILIDFRVPERFIGQFGPGTPVEVRPLAREDSILAGEIVALDNVVDRASRTLRVQARLANEDDSLRAGMAFSVALSFPGEMLPSVDPLAVQWSGDGAFVWAVREGKAERVPVVIRQRNSDSVLVEADLAPGDAVITEGIQTLRPGAEVVVVTGAAAPADAAAAPRAARDI